MAGHVLHCWVAGNIVLIRSIHAQTSRTHLGGSGYDEDVCVGVPLTRGRRTRWAAARAGDRDCQKRCVMRRVAMSPCSHV